MINRNLLKPTIIAKAILHLVVLVTLSLILLWILFYLHGSGINSGLIPDQPRFKNGARSEYFNIWLILFGVISYLEWFALLIGVDKFNRWYGQEWLIPSQQWVSRVATVTVGVVTAICVALFYIPMFKAE